MNVAVRRIGRIAVTILMVVSALLAARWLWRHYNEEPWTRDGRIRADVVEVSPDINGLVTDVRVRDDQSVRKGDVLFVIDQPRYALALEQAKASVAAAKAALTQAIREARRNRALTTLVTAEQVEQGNSKVEQLQAELAQALVLRDIAVLNLQRTVVRATVNGVVTNVELQPGNYAVSGHQVLALVNTDSIYVDGYFEETKLPLINVGDPAIVHVMGLESDMHGHVEGIAAGIEDRERGPSSNELANVNPTFSWVRLAQRIPVRIELEKVPANIRLITGRTVTVTILPPAGRRPEGAP
jgi:multidrug resistance efflux pump